MMRIFVPIVCGHVHANCSEHVGSLGSGKCHFLRPVFFYWAQVLVCTLSHCGEGDQEPVLGEFIFSLLWKL